VLSVERVLGRPGEDFVGTVIQNLEGREVQMGGFLDLLLTLGYVCLFGLALGFR